MKDRDYADHLEYEKQATRLQQWWFAHGVVVLFWILYLGLMGYGLWGMMQ